MKEFLLNTSNMKNLAYELYGLYRDYGSPVFLCVGSDKFVFDSLGPIIAEKLRKEYNISAYVYGGLDYNINATNVMVAINYLETIHPSSPIILIDATLSSKTNSVLFGNGAFVSRGDTMPVKRVGLYSILGVVGKSKHNFDLNSTRLKTVLNLSDFIAKTISMSINVWERRLLSSNVF